MNSGRLNTIKQLLQQARQRIDPSEAEILVAHALNKTREFVMAHPEMKVRKVHKVKKFIKSVNQRANGEPIAYLTGHKEFFGLDFEVNKSVLIPRPDTETMVEEVIKEIEKIGKKFKKEIEEIFLIDVGTGSGCIPISIIKTLKHKNIKTIAIDISQLALRVAKKNARRHHVKIKFLHGDLLEPFLKICNLKHITCNLIITANLPYLTQKQFNHSPTIKYEPKQALVAKNKGLALYTKLIKQIKQVTRYKLHVTSFFEIDPSQSSRITKLIKSILPNAKTQIIKDLAGLDRVVKIEVNHINESKPKKQQKPEAR